MDEEKLRATVTDAVGKAIDNKLGSFFIEREQHYQDHLFVSDVRKGAAQVKNAGLWAFGLGVFGAVVWGVKTWVVSLVKGH